MKVMVTGGAGFIGSHIVDAYIARGHEVCIVDDLSTGKRENINPKATFHQLDIRDAVKVQEVCQRERCEVLNHHAAQMDVRRSVADPAFDASVNIIGILNLLEAGAKSGLRRVIFASSGGAIYGEQDAFPADETHPCRPISPYGVAKLSSEQYLFYYKVVYGIDFTNMRYANIYGPRQNPGGEAGVIAIFTTKMLRNEQAIVNGDGKQTRDYTFVGDVVKANVLALEHPGSDSFNIGTGIETNVNQLFDRLAVLTGTSIKRQHKDGKKGEQMRSVLDASKASRVLGWKPTVSLEEGLSRTVDFFKSGRVNVA